MTMEWVDTDGDGIKESYLPVGGDGGDTSSGSTSSGGGVVIGGGTVDIGGIPYQRNPQTGNLERVSRGGDLTYAEQVALRGTPSRSVSSSSSVSQSLQDPRALAIQERGLAQDRELTLADLQQEADLFGQQQQQEREQFFASLQQDHNQYMQTLALERESLAASIYETDANLAVQQANLNFLQDKFAFESQHASKELALATQSEMFSQRATVAQIADRRSQMVQDVRNLNVQMQAENQRFNAQMKFAVDQANQQAEQARQDRLQTLARDIGTLAQDPGSRGALAAEILANRSGSFSDVTDDDFRTEESLTPLDMLLTQREAAMQPQTPFDFEAQEAPQIEEPTFGALPEVADFSQITAGGDATFTPTPFSVPERRQLGTPGGTSSSGAVYQPEAQYAQTPFGKTIPSSPAPDRSQITSLPVGGSMVGDNGFTYTNYGADRGAFSALSPEAAAQIPAWVRERTGVNFEEGGISTGPGYTVGEEGEEFVLKLSDGQDLIIPRDKVSPAVWKRLQRHGKAKMQEGGVFASIFGPDTPNTTLARPFLEEASRRARTGTPWETGELPGITAASTPGLDPVVVELLGSLNSLERGVPAEYFQRQAARATPFGISPGVGRRTA